MTYPYPVHVAYWITGLAASIGYRPYAADGVTPLGPRVAGASEDGETAAYNVVAALDTAWGDVVQVVVDDGVDVIHRETVVQVAHAARAAAEAAADKGEEVLDAAGELADDLADVAAGVVGIGDGTDAMLDMTTGVGVARAFLANALAAAPSGGGGGGESATAIWQHPERTLTSFPPGYTLTLPQPGVGAFIAGARLEGQGTAFRLVALAGSSVTLMARVVGVDRDYINRAKTAAVSSSITNLQEAAADADTAAHAVLDVVYDALRVDAGWTEDAYGFNLAVPISGSRIGAAGTTYRVDVTLVGVDGNPIIVRWDVQT